MKNILIDGRYLLLAPVGTGGEARVFRARDQETGNDVAVRLALHPRPQTVPADFPVTHESWVQRLAAGTDPQHGIYSVYELLVGSTLSQVVQASPLSAEAWRTLVDQSLAAVEALHDAGWTHGDLNADNFFQTSTTWKLLELPFYRLDPPMGRSAAFGSIHTLAPEQFDGAPASILTDTYSLGCLFYYAASGAFPHPGTSSAEVAINCLRFPAEPLADKAPALPASCSTWVMHLLARNPSDRPATLAAARQLLGVA